MSEVASIAVDEPVAVIESAGRASLPASEEPMPMQQVEQQLKKRGWRFITSVLCCAAPQCKEPSSLSSPSAAPAAASSSVHSCVCEHPCAGHQTCPGIIAATKPRHSNPFASALQQQQSGEVLQALQSCKSGQLQPGASQQLSGILSEDWFETKSMFSEAFSLEQQLSEQLLAAQQQASTPAPALQLQQTGPWVPETPLLFAEPGMRFIPVPAVTGFAGFWEVDAQRTTAHPQPIDVMNGASFIVRRVHKSIHAMVLGETEGQLTLAARPGFLPPGLPASYCEVYDKTNKAESTWTPRRDMRLGSCSGKVYMTDSNVLILRVEARPPFHKGKVDTISEAYITKEEGGQVLVSRMCCMDLPTGRTATQLQVARLRPGSG